MQNRCATTVLVVTHHDGCALNHHGDGSILKNPDMQLVTRNNALQSSISIIAVADFSIVLYVVICNIYRSTIDSRVTLYYLWFYDTSPFLFCCKCI